MSLDPDDPRPPYEQVAAALRAQILTRKIAPGDRLASQAELRTDPDPGVLIVTTTVATDEAARSIAADLVAEHLAACVQINGPIVSTYRWDGQIKTEAEWELSIKTTMAGWHRLADWLVQHHPYETPQVLATMATASSPSYLDWVAEETKPS